MATIFVIPSESPVLLREKLVTFSGSVLSSLGAPLSRKILVYKRPNNTKIVGETMSSAIDGTFSLQINAGPNDLFRVIAIASDTDTTENTRVFDKVHE